MAVLIRWQFDSCNAIPHEGYDKWWEDMHIDGQLLCEEALCFCGVGKSLVFFETRSSGGSRIQYKIDLVRMFQQNLRTGRIRPIRRTIMHGFSLKDCYFERGKLMKRRLVEPGTEARNQKHRRLRE